MKQYNVTGMSCAACAARVEKAVNKVEGVTECSVSLLTNSMGVEGSASDQAIIAAVQGAGYGASAKGGDRQQSSAAADYDDALKDTETPRLRKRLIASLGFLLVLMYFSMGHMMWGWPIPSWFDGNHVAMGLLQLLLTTIVMVINQKFFISGFKSLLGGSPNMDTLVALGSTASYVYSVYALFAMTDAQVKGGAEAAMPWMHEFYFESAAMILTLITVGKMLEAHSKGRTTDALKGLMKLAPKTAVLLQDGEEVTVSIEQVKQGDIFVVRPGENIPVDGVILEGNSAINESALTGESIPVDKAEGDLVSAATINQSGYIKCEATRVGEDTTLSQIIQMVSDAAATKAPAAKVADKVSGIFVPVVIVIAIITLAVWLLVGQTIGFALARAISVLVISCPCALGLATPVAIMVGNGMGAKNGILFKTAAALEAAGKVQIVALDKTGTITSGVPKVTDIIPAEGISENELLSMANTLEKRSEHPLARAILSLAEERQIEAEEVNNFKALPGNGLTAEWDGKILCGGNYAFITTQSAVPDSIRIRSEELAEEGKTPLFFSCNGQLIGIIAVADVIKEDSPQAVKEMQDMGIHVVMLTGDNERTAKAIGWQAGVNQVIAGVLPDGKESVISSLKEYGKVAMVGDGINDAPALTSADTGIAIGAGTDVAIDAAEVVLMKSRLSDVPAAIRLSRATLKNIHENLFWAFIYNVIGIPLAAGCYIALFGWKLNPMFGAAAMSLSSFCVVSNALRLNLFKMHETGKDKRLKKAVSSDTLLHAQIGGTDPVASIPGAEAAIPSDTHLAAAGLGASATGSVTASNIIPSSDSEGLQPDRILHIEGMMCGNCERHVRQALEAIDGVEKAAASYETGIAQVFLNAEVSDDVLKKSVDDEGYPVISIDHRNKNNFEEDPTMTKTLKVEGMMCNNCEKHVKKALEAIDGVESAVASHEAGTAVVTLSADVADDILKAAVEAEEYKVTGIE